MSDFDLYRTLDVDPAATPTEIKQAYRRLVRLFHPDSHHVMANHERITQVNAAYAILKDPQRRQRYDQTLRSQTQINATVVATASADWSQQQTHTSQTQYHQTQTARATEIHLQQWLQQVYSPVNRQLAQILSQLNPEITQLSADPFDDELMTDFQAYLADCRDDLAQAQVAFQSMPNPANLAGVAAQLYYCLNHIEDGIEELERFTLCYDDGYLNTGRELFRMSAKLRSEAQAAMRAVL